MPVDVKICGLNTPEAVDAACAGGAAMCGFVFFPPSPRWLEFAAARPLTARVPAGVGKVGLVVDADDAWLERVAATGVDWLQLHGGETPDRILEVKRKFALPVIKAAAISGPDDIVRARDYEDAADRLLFDAKPPKGATRPGGNALAFDWELIRGQAWKLPWLLAGGLDITNMAEAVAVSGATMLDVSSGVEDGPGIKNVEKIGAFLAAARGL